MLIKIVVSVTFGVEFELKYEEWSCHLISHDDSKHRGLKTEAFAKRTEGKDEETKKWSRKRRTGRGPGASCACGAQAARRTADEAQVARESVQVARARSWENYCFALFHNFGRILSSTSPF